MIQYLYTIGITIIHIIDKIRHWYLSVFHAEELGWTSWELYNFVLIGLTNELIELGVSTDIKITVLQLWARYLGKLEIGFISAKKKLIPKLARRYKKRLLYCILYNEPFVSKISDNSVNIFFSVNIIFTLVEKQLIFIWFRFFSERFNILEINYS